MDEFDMVNVMSDLQNMIDKSLEKQDAATMWAINVVVLIESMKQFIESNPLVINDSRIRNVMYAATSLCDMFEDDQLEQANQLVNKVYVFAEDIREKYGN